MSTYTALASLVYADSSHSGQRIFTPPTYWQGRNVHVGCSCHLAENVSIPVPDDSSISIPVWNGAFFPDHDILSAESDGPHTPSSSNDDVLAFHSNGKPFLSTLMQHSGKMRHVRWKPERYPAPCSRSGHVFHPVEHQIILYGGQGVDAHSDTWAFDPTTRRWRELCVGPVPAEVPIYRPPGGYGQAYAAFHPSCAAGPCPSLSPSASPPSVGRHEHLFIFGGYSDKLVNDAAEFCCRTETWRLLPLTIELPCMWGSVSQTLRQPRRLRRLPEMKCTSACASCYSHTREDAAADDGNDENEEEVVVMFGGMTETSMIRNLYIFHLERPLTSADCEEHGHHILEDVERSLQDPTVPDRASPARPTNGRPMIEECVGKYWVEVICQQQPFGPKLRRRPGCVSYQKHKMLIFGGRDEISFFNDTWEWNSRTRQWRELCGVESRLPNGQLKTRYVPSPRTGAAMVVDERRGIVILSGGFRRSESKIRLLGDIEVLHIEKEEWQPVRFNQFRPWMAELDFYRSSFPAPSDVEEPYLLELPPKDPTRRGVYTESDPISFDHYLHRQLSASWKGAEKPSEGAVPFFTQFRRKKSGDVLPCSRRRRTTQADRLLLETGVMEKPMASHRFPLPTFSPRYRTMAAMCVDPTNPERIFLYGGRYVDESLADLFEITLTEESPLQKMYEFLLKTRMQGKIDGPSCFDSLQRMLCQDHLEYLVRQESPFYYEVARSSRGLRECAVKFLSQSEKRSSAVAVEG